MLAYKEAWYNLRKGIIEAKRKYKQHLEEHFNTNNSRGMWQGIKTLSGYKDNFIDTNSTDTLNHFFSRFVQPDTAVCIRPTLPGKDDPILLTQHQVRSTLRRVDAKEAAGPDVVTGRILRACLDQLSEVFTTIFNLSLQQSAVPTCLKSATIIPVPKKRTVNCFNDYCPVPLPH